MCSNAQTYEYMKLNEAYDYAVNSSGFSTFDFITAQAIDSKNNPLMNINLDDGTSTLWILTGKPKDGSTENGLTLTILKLAGQFMSQGNVVPGDYSGFPIINNDFANSDALTAQLKNSSEFMNFYNSNKDSLSIMEFNLGFSFGDISQMVWTTTMINVNASDMLTCFWDYKTLAKILCSSVSGVEDNELINFDVFPNPSSDIVSFEIPYSGFANCSIYDNLGNIVQSSSMNIDNHANINISSLNNGVYNLVIKIGKSVLSKQIIKVK